jgi:uncharacterized membrane protein YphA (DoxX/SURF4 family)
MDSRPQRGKRIALWILKIALGLAFMAAGFSKLAGAPPMVAIFAKIGFGQWLRILTGFLEVAGAIGLFVPRYTFFAASLLATVMVGAVGFHLAMLGGNPTPPIVLLILALVTAWLSKPSARSETQTA